MGYKTRLRKDRSRQALLDKLDNRKKRPTASQEDLSVWVDGHELRAGLIIANGTEADMAIASVNRLCPDWIPANAMVLPFDIDQQYDGVAFFAGNPIRSIGSVMPHPKKSTIHQLYTSPQFESAIYGLFHELLISGQFYAERDLFLSFHT